MNLKEQVLSMLKPKVKALGFNKKELGSVADIIVANLNLAEDASEEDANVAIGTQIDAVLPLLQISQSLSNRAIDKYKQEHPVVNDDDDDDDDDDSKGAGKDGKKGHKKGESNSGLSADELKELITNATKAATAPLEQELAKLKGEKVTTNRLSQLKDVLKDTGAYGKSVEKQFSRMSFDDDEAFNEYLEEIKGDITAINQERSNSGLSKLGVPPASGGGDVVELTDDELDKMAAEF